MTHTKESIKAAIMDATNPKSEAFVRAPRFEFDGFSVICQFVDHFAQLELLAKTNTGGRFVATIKLSEMEIKKDSVFKQFMTEDEAAEAAAKFIMMLAAKPLDEIEKMAYHDKKSLHDRSKRTSQRVRLPVARIAR